MNRSIWLWLLLLLAWIILASFIWQKYLCEPSKKSIDSTENGLSPTPNVPTSDTWIYSDGGAYRVAVSDHLSFKEASPIHLQPLAPDLREALQTTAEYLKDHSARQLIITGLYRSDEDNPSSMANLGLARAQDIADYLISIGAPIDRIKTIASISSRNWSSDGILSKGVDFAFSASAESDDRLLAIKSRLSDGSMNLHFPVNEHRINLTPKQEAYLDDIVYYLDNVPSGALTITGHTDGTGKRRHNMRLSKRRADFVAARLFTNKKIDRSKIKTKGLGPDQPISDNATARGRAENRRVNVALQ